MVDPEGDDLEERALATAYYSSGRVACTVAIFAPAATIALARPPAALAAWKCPPTLTPEEHDRVPPGADLSAATAVVRAYQAIIVAADSRGFLRVYENTAPRVHVT